MTMKGVQRDDDLPHQIRLFWIKQGATVFVGVGCVCRQGRFKKTEAFAILKGDETPWKYYNNPEHHSPHSKIPFDESFQGGPPETRTGFAKALRHREEA